MRRFGIVTAVVSTIAFCFAAQAAAEQWVRKSPGAEPYVRSVRVFANTPTTGQAIVYAATLSNGVLKIVDDGSSLAVSQVNSGLPTLRIRGVGGLDINNLYAGLDGHGVYKTADGGTSWVAANGSGASALGCRDIRNISVRSSTEIWAVTSCIHSSGVYRTLDGGATWSRLGAATIPDDASVGAITFSGTGAATVVVVSTGRDGIFRSADNGATWTQINSGLPAPAGANRISVFNTAFLSNASQMLAYVEGHGVYRTLNAGASWSAFGTGLPNPVYALAGLIRESSTVFYMGTDKGPVYRSGNAGLTWSVWGNSGTSRESKYVRSVTDDATAAGRYYLPGAAGLARTTDNGATFSRIPIGEGFVSSMYLDPDGKTAYLATETLLKLPDLYASTTSAGVDIGVGLPGTLSGGSVAQDKTRPATLFAGLNNHGLYKSSDGGSTWTRLNLPNVNVGTNPFVEISPSSGLVVYAAPGNKFSTATGGGLYKSIDGGVNWTEISTGLNTPDARDVNSIALHQDAPSAMVIATDDGLYRSSDGGANWTATLQVSDELGTKLPMSSVRFHPLDPLTVYATANHRNPDGTVRSSSGVWKSVNGGATWTQVLSGKRTSAIRPENSGRVVVMLQRDLSQPALLASSDGGTTWVAFNNGIADNDGETLSRSVREQGSQVAFASMTTGIYVLDQRPERLSNLSTRGQVQTGDNVMIGGFIIGGATPKKVLVTARGPSLAAFGVSGAMANPSLQLFSGQTVIASNDDWGAAGNAAEIRTTGLAPTDALESAILTTLSPGAYTAIVSGVGGGTGVGIVEVFEMDHPEIPLTNLSTRGQVQTGDNVMIGGFVISGSSPKTVLVTARGPSLTAFGVQGALANPSLQLYSGQTVVASNDDWGSATNAAAIQATGRAPTNALESAILVTLAPGAYTAVVSGVGGATGVGIVEVFAQ